MAECFWRDLSRVEEDCFFALAPTIYTFQQTFEQPGGNGLDTNFASAVAIAGDRAVVGAKDAGALTKQGMIFVYEYTTAWALAASLNGPSPLAHDKLGAAVDIDGDYIIAGSPDSDENGSWSGAAQIFFRAAGTWAWQDELLASDGSATDYMGTSVAIIGDYALVGAPEAGSGGTGRGQVYVFKRTGTVWAQIQILTASDKADNDRFGGSIAVGNFSFGNTAVIGATGRNSSAGAVYHFNRTGDVWSEIEIETAPVPAAGVEFGQNLRSERTNFGNPNVVVQDGNGLTYRIWYGHTFDTPMLMVAPAAVGAASPGVSPDQYVVVPVIGASGYELEVYAQDSETINIPYVQLEDETMYAREGAEPFTLDSGADVNTEQTVDPGTGTLGHMVVGFSTWQDVVPAIHEVSFFSYIVTEAPPE